LKTVVVATLCLSSCALTTTPRSDVTLPPLGSHPPQAAPATNPILDAAERRWYAEHSGAVRRHRAAIDELAAGLAAGDVVKSQIALCQMGEHIDDDASMAAYEAAGAHPDWVRAVELARWMFATCASGDVAAVASIIPELTDRLYDFDDWLSTISALRVEQAGRR
jgi:hypothetical protein